MSRLRDGRHASIAARISGLDPATATSRLAGREVVLDWPAEIERTRAGVALIRTTANMVVRFCPQLRLRPTTALADELGAVLAEIDPDAAPARSAGRDALVVHLGGVRAAEVTGSAEGWTAHVSGYGEPLPPLRDADVVIGAHGAAALVASQVFARALPLDARVAGPSPATAYSLFEYGPPTLAPRSVAEFSIDGVLLAGVGAVGQACVDVLVSSEVAGRLTVADLGSVDDPTNLNRSVLALERDLEARTPKVQLAMRRAAGTPLEVEAHASTLADVVAAIESGALPWPRVALSALDNRDARWALQSLWPDLVVEGATGGTMVQVFRHAHADATACLRCLHPDERPAEGYAQRMAQATGLGLERVVAALRGGEATVKPQDVAAAEPGLREIVVAHVGRDVCGLLTNVERYLGPYAEPVQLSVSFSSYLAGVFLAAELMKSTAGLSSPLGGRYQIDPLASLRADPPFVQNATASCICQSRPEVVAGVRSAAERLRRAVGRES